MTKHQQHRVGGDSNGRLTSQWCKRLHELCEFQAASFAHIQKVQTAERFCGAPVKILLCYCVFVFSVVQIAFFLV